MLRLSCFVSGVAAKCLTDSALIAGALEYINEPSVNVESVGIKSRYIGSKTVEGVGQIYLASYIESTCSNLQYVDLSDISSLVRGVDVIQVDVIYDFCEKGHWIVRGIPPVQQTSSKLPMSWLLSQTGNNSEATKFTVSNISLESEGVSDGRNPCEHTVAFEESVAFYWIGCGESYCA